MVYHHDIPHSLPAPDVEPRFGRRRKWIEALIAAAKCLFVTFVKTVVVFLAKTMWKAFFQVRVLQKHVIASIFSKLQRIFFYFAIFTPRKKETRHIIEVSHDRCLGVWCKGICKYDQSFRQGVISHSISRSDVSWVSGDLARAPRGSLWHCSTTIRRRCRPIQKLAKRSCLSVKDRWVGHRFDAVCLVCCEI